jgi:hypothetical protein
MHVARSITKQVLGRLLLSWDTQDLQTIKQAIQSYHKTDDWWEVEVTLKHFGQPVMLDKQYLLLLQQALTKKLICERLATIDSPSKFLGLSEELQTLISDAAVYREIINKMDSDTRGERSNLAIWYDRWADIQSVRALIAKLESEELWLQLRGSKWILTSTEKNTLDLIQQQVISLYWQLARTDEHGNRVWLEVESREVASMVRLEQLLDYGRQKKQSGFVKFPSREEIMQEIREAVLSGKSTLISGATGTGKTVLAVQVAKQIQHKWVELALWWIIDGQALSDELQNNPDYVHVLSGNANMTVGEIIAKLGIKTVDDGKWGKVMETTTQLGKILKAYSEWKIPIFDEIDLVPNDILMRTKHLATLSPWEIYTPQENGGMQVWIKNNIQLATANLKGAHHPDREDLDPAIVRLYQWITAWYLTKDEAYDLALISCMDTNGAMIGISPVEWNKDGFVMQLVEFMKQVEDNYMWHAALGTGIDASDQYLSKAVMDIGIFTGLFAGRETNRRSGSKIRNRREYVTDNLIKFLTNAGYPLSDRKILLKMANQKGLIDATHKASIMKRSPDLNDADRWALITSATSQIAEYDTKTIAIMTPYEIAQLDPYDIRQIDQLQYSQYAQLGELSLILGEIEWEYVMQSDHSILEYTQTLIEQISTDKSLNETMLDTLMLELEEQLITDEAARKHRENIGNTILWWASLGRIQPHIDARVQKRAEEAERLKREQKAKEQRKHARALLQEMISQAQSTVSTLKEKEKQQTLEDAIKQATSALWSDDLWVIQSQIGNLQLATPTTTPKKPKASTGSVPQTLTPLGDGPQLDHILQYRQDFESQVKRCTWNSHPQHNNTKTISQLVTIAKDMLDKWYYTPCTHAGLVVHRFDLPWWWQWGFGDSSGSFTPQQCEDHPDVFRNYEHNNKILSKGKKSFICNEAMKHWDTYTDDVSERQEPVKSQVQEWQAHGISPDLDGDLQSWCEAMKTQYPSMTDCDVLTIYMYFTGQYGRYRTGWLDSAGSRGGVILVDDRRRFQSSDNDGSCCLLLLSRRWSAPQSHSGTNHLNWAQTVSTTDIPLQAQWVRKWWTDNVNNLWNGINKQELITKMNERVFKHVRYLSNPKWLWSSEYAVQITHPDYNSGKARTFYEPSKASWQSATGNDDVENLSMSYGDPMWQTDKLSIKLRSIRWDISKPDTLSDIIYQDEQYKTGAQEPNHTKTYLTYLQSLGIQYRTESVDQMTQLMDLIGKDLLLAPENWENKPLRKAVMQYVMSKCGYYWNSDYTGDSDAGSRRYVTLFDNGRSFGSLKSRNNYSSLLLSRDW